MRYRNGERVHFRAGEVCGFGTIDQTNTPDNEFFSLTDVQLYKGVESYGVYQGLYVPRTCIIRNKS